AKFDVIESPEHLEIDLNSIPGVVENGIFSQMVDKVIVGTEDGTKEL
ncbi:MAG: ribose-5-phosphate isomerase A, partial [Methanobrevibacter sp.]|nr:ribose-5-phosphate isomerase A [Methanobrevibacter sp.]